MRNYLLGTRNIVLCTWRMLQRDSPLRSHVLLAPRYPLLTILQSQFLIIFLRKYITPIINHLLNFAKLHKFSYYYLRFTTTI